MTQKLQFKRNIPWNDMPLLPPAGEIESADILKACIPAMTELAKANALVKTLPNKEVLIHTLPLQEARRSSEIENIVTTNDELYRAMTSKNLQISPSTKEILRYREALWLGVNRLHEQTPLNRPLFEQICSCICDAKMHIRDDGVMIINDITQEVIYTSPKGYENIVRLLTNLEHFINDDNNGFQTLVKMAVMHYQFEAIHPFEDGNGRTGRILNILYLMRQGLLDVPILYLSRYFIQNRLDYYRCLREVTENGEWQQWILYVLAAVEQISRETAHTIASINSLIENIISQAQGKTKAIEREGFVDILFKWPYCKINIVERELKCNRHTATKYLNEIAGLGFLERRKVGREYYYINSKLMDLLSNV